MKTFQSLTEREVLALAIALEEEDAVLLLGGVLVFLAGILIGSS